MEAYQRNINSESSWIGIECKSNEIFYSAKLLLAKSKKFCLVNIRQW